MIGYIRISSVEYERDNTKLKSAHITNFHVQVYHNHSTFDPMLQPKLQSAPTRLQRECEDYDYEHDTVGGVRSDLRRANSGEKATRVADNILTTKNK